MKTMQERVASAYWHPSGEPKSRLRELILYIAERCESHEVFGAMKLNKLLFLADFTSYLEHRESISGSQYCKLPQGPVPVHLFPLRKEMMTAGDLAVRKEKITHRTQHRVVPLRQPNVDILTGRDVTLLNKIIDDLKGLPAREKGDLPHGLAFEVAEVREIIPYETVLLDNRGLQRHDVEEAHRLIQEQGWGGV